MAAEAVTWPTPPTLTDANDSGQSYFLGCAFTVTTGRACSGIRWRVPDSVSAPPGGSHLAQLWVSGAPATRVRNQIFTPVPGSTQDIPFTTEGDYALLSGTTYLASVWSVHYTFRAGAGLFPIASPSGNISATGGRLGISSDPGTGYPDTAGTSIFYVSPLADDGGGGGASQTVTGTAVALSIGTASNIFSVTSPTGLAVPVSIGTASSRGLTAPTGVAAAVSIGTITSTTDSPYVPDLTAPNGWRGYQSILSTARQQLREDRAARPVACPNDGQPLLSHNGKSYCPWGDWRER